MCETTTKGGAVALSKAQRNIGAVLVLALLSVNGLNLSTTSGAKSEISELRIEVRVLKEKLEAATDDRYRGTQARSDFDLRDERISQLRADLKALAVEFRRHADLGGHAVMLRRAETIEKRLDAIERRK